MASDLTTTVETPAGDGALHKRRTDMPDSASSAVVAWDDASVAMTDTVSDLVLRHLVEAPSAGLTPAELDSGLSCSGSTRQRAVARLISHGLATRQGERGRIRATDAGRNRIRDGDRSDRRAWPRGTLADLDRAVALLPTAAHRATFRLIVDSVVARWHLHRDEPSGWPSFVLVGDTGCGKSLAGEGACRLFGLEPALHVRSLPAESERSLWGRRYQPANRTWALEPAEVLSWPLLVLDEANKAEPPVRRASLRLLQGEVRIPGEGRQLVTVKPTVVVTSNGGPDLVPEEYRRRSIVWHLHHVPESERQAVERIAQTFLDTLPVFDLDAFEVPILGSAVLDRIGPQLRAGLSEQGQRLAGARYLSRLVAGRMAVRGLDIAAATSAVVGDYLDTAETVGETPAPGPVEPAPDAAERRRAAEAEQARQREIRRRERAEDIELRGLTGQLVDGLRQVRPDPASFDPPYRSEAALVAGHIDALIDQAEEASSLDELREVTEDGRSVVDDARAIASQKLPELPRAPSLPREVIDVTADTDDEGWWCNGCQRDFDEPDVRGWLRWDVCPLCESRDIEWLDSEDGHDELPASTAEDGAALLLGWPHCYVIDAQCGHLLAGKVTPGDDLPRTAWAWCSACDRTVCHRGWSHEHGSNVPAHAVSGWLVEESPATGHLLPGETCPHGRSVLPGTATVYCTDCRRSYDLRPAAALGVHPRQTLPR